MDFELISISANENGNGHAFEATFDEPNALLYMNDTDGSIQGYARLYDFHDELIRDTPTVCIDFTQGVVTRPETPEERAELLLEAVLDADEQSELEKVIVRAKENFEGRDGGAVVAVYAQRYSDRSWSVAFVGDDEDAYTYESSMTRWGTDDGARELFEQSAEKFAADLMAAWDDEWTEEA